MGQRAVKGLSDLGGEVGRGMVGGAMVLAVGRRKLGLEKQAVARDPVLRECLQGVTHQGFLVMDQLIGRVDGPEACRHGGLHQSRRGFFFPGRAVHERRNRNVVVGGHGHDVAIIYLTDGFYVNESGGRASGQLPVCEGAPLGGAGNDRISVSLFHGETGISRATAFCRIRIRHARVGVRDSPQHEGSRSLEATASGYSPLPLQTNRNGSAGATALCHRLPRDRVPSSPRTLRKSSPTLITPTWRRGTPSNNRLPAFPKTVNLLVRPHFKCDGGIM